jgi:hypothetical protein
MIETFPYDSFYRLERKQQFLCLKTTQVLPGLLDELLKESLFPIDSQERD